VFSTARRVGSASAANMLSSSSSAYLTIGFSIYRHGKQCQGPYTFRV
jgi:hypothetical protein